MKGSNTMLEIIRNDAKVGRGSCSSIDECMEDREILEELNELNITSPKEALKWAYDRESMYWEQGLNQRWGEDDDEQLLCYNEWQEKLKD